MITIITIAIILGSFSGACFGAHLAIIKEEEENGKD